MRLSKDEITEQLAHKKAIVRALTARQRPLELQAAQKGLNTPPETLTEIASLTDQIRIQEDEIAKLETLAAEGQHSVAEVEYRLMLAEAWDTSIGRPTAAGAARLELARLQMGLSPDRAQGLEREIRMALAEEIFLSLDIGPLLGQASDIPGINAGSPISVNISGTTEHAVAIQTLIVNQSVVVSNPLESALQLIGKAIRLDITTALRLFLQLLPPETTINTANFGGLLFNANRIWIYKDEKPLFEQFVDELASTKAKLILPDGSTS